MQTSIVNLPTAEIVDWDTFHAAFRETLGFPDFYGNNMNAWIDCLTYADDAQSGMISRPVARGELLALRIDGAADFKARCAEQYDALVECAAFVNFRRIEAGERPVLALILA